MTFGPEYTKIDTAFKRDGRGVIISGDWATEEFAYLADREWRWTEKVDGTNIRLHWNGESVKVGGRTNDAQIPTFLLAAISDRLSPELWKEVFQGSSNVTVYGEGYGGKIQKGKQYREDCGIAVFDVLIGNWWLKPNDVYDVVTKLDLEQVPDIRSFWTLEEAVEHVRTGDLTSRWPNARIEGLVGRPLVDLFNRKGERIITKIKGKDFADLERRGGASPPQQDAGGGISSVAPGLLTPDPARQHPQPEPEHRD